MVQDSIDKLVKHYSVEHNILKAVEECAELSEVLIKYLTKNEQLRPNKEKISEEMGDVIFRVLVAAQTLGLTDDVEGRMDYKAKQMYDYAVKKFETT